MDGKFFGVGVGVNGQNPTNTYKGKKMHETSAQKHFVAMINNLNRENLLYLPDWAER